jgi:excisionase family DNA binding protein
VQCTVSKEYEAMSTRTSNIFRDNVSTTPLSVTIKVACKLVGIGNTTMWNLIKTRRVKTVKIGRRRLIIFSSLESLLAAEVGKKQ